MDWGVRVQHSDQEFWGFTLGFLSHQKEASMVLHANYISPWAMWVLQWHGHSNIYLAGFQKNAAKGERRAGTPRHAKLFHENEDTTR